MGMHASQVKNGGADPHAIDDLTQAVVEDGVAQDPEYALLLALPAKGETDRTCHRRAGITRPNILRLVFQ